MSSEFEMISWAQAGLSLLMLAVYALGMVACIVYRRASGSTTLLLVGFGVVIGAVLLRMLAQLFPPLYLASPEPFLPVNVVLSVIGLLGNGLIVGGLFAVLGDVCRRLDRARDLDRGDDYGRRRDYAGEPPAALPRNPGSPDIQR